MLSWRLILGFALLAMLAGLAWLDFYAPRPGLFLAPLGIGCVVLATGELVRLFEHNAALPRPADLETVGGLAPSRYVVSTGAALVMTISFAPLLWKEYPSDCPIGRIGWLALGLAAGVLMAVVIEMVRYRQPGVATLRLALGVLAIVYCGGMMGFAAQLRLLGGPPWDADGHWGMVALLSMMAVVKAHDTGAYTAGRLFGRHKMTPLLSPGKTWEGFAGGTALSVVAAGLCLGPLAHALGCDSGQPMGRWLVGVAVYGLLVGLAGVVGDLAISLLKRDSHLKNSSSWMPGFGGVLDVVDSMLPAAPVAYALWVTGLVGP